MKSQYNVDEFTFQNDKALYKQVIQYITNNISVSKVTQRNPAFSVKLYICSIV